MAGVRPAGAFGGHSDLPISEFKSRLTEAVTYAVPSAATTKRYRRVRVLLVSWLIDDLRVGNEVLRLRDTLQNTYDYACKIFKIPAAGPESPRQALLGNMMELMAGTDADDLLIFYYAGQGVVGRNPGEGPCVFV